MPVISSYTLSLQGRGRRPPAPALILPLLLAGCAAGQSALAVASTGPGFWLGLWHGFIFPFAWVASLFLPDVAIYAVPNNGGWYDFGYFLGIVVFGVGARKSLIEIHGPRHTSIHRTTVHETVIREGEVIDGLAGRPEEQR